MVKGAVKVFGDPPANLFASVVQRRHIDALDGGQRRELLSPFGALEPVETFQHLRDEHLTVPHHKGVDKGGDRLRRKRADTAGKDERMLFPALRGAERYSREIEDRQDIRV